MFVSFWCCLLVFVSVNTSRFFLLFILLYAPWNIILDGFGADKLLPILLLHDVSCFCCWFVCLLSDNAFSLIFYGSPVFFTSKTIENKIAAVTYLSGIL